VRNQAMGVTGSLARRFTLLLGVSVLLVTLSGLFTLHLATIQRQDALTVNLAGRQRMLVQAIVRKALAQAVAPSDSNLQALRDAFDTFRATLLALRYGGPAPYADGREVVIPVPSDAETVAQLERVISLWRRFGAQVQALTSSRPGEPEFSRALGEIDRLSAPLSSATDAAVRSFERVATRRVDRLRWFQAMFILSAMALLAEGSWWVYHQVVDPLRRLEEVAHRIGHGDLDAPLPPMGVGEIERLSRRLEIMRKQLKSARDDLEARIAARTRELEAIHEIGQGLVSRLEVEHILNSVVGVAKTFLRTEVAALCLLDDACRYVRLGAFSGPSGILRTPQVPIEKSFTKYLIQGHKSAVFHCADCKPECCSLLTIPFPHDHLAVPVQVEGRILGALCVAGTDGRHIPPEETRLLRLLADSAAIALNNARLYQQAKELAALEERERIAGEMHDRLVQTLSYLHLQVDQALEELSQGDVPRARLARVRDTLAQVVQDVREAITTLHVTAPSPRMLGEILRQVVGETLRESSRDGAVELEVVEDWPVGHETSIHVQRIVQEALVNAFRHARAHQVVVRVYREGAAGVVCVEDDGIGFDPLRPPDNARPHFGLSIMKARAARIGGDLFIHSAPGQGTRITLRCPVKGGTYGHTADHPDAGRG